MTLLVPFDRPLVRGRLLRRYKRFFVDAVLDDGRAIVAHTANTGAMTGLVVEDAPVLVSVHDTSVHGKRARSMPYELEAIHVDGAWVSVNTGSANAFAAKLVERGLVAELAGYDRVRREVSPPRSKSRFDLCLERNDSCAYVEVKSVTLKSESRALFPDAVTERGRKHLDALARLARRGRRAAMLYVNKRAGCTSFAAAKDIDPAYATALTRAKRAGVEVYCVDCAVDERGLSFAGRLDVELA
jgi:sugar fermentation stimulation protein A